MAEKQAPSIGRIVHYVLPDGSYKGEHRPAIIVRVWNDDMVNLHVFPDGENDYYGINAGAMWVTSVHEDPTGQEPRTFHFPEYVPAKAAD